MLTSLEVQQHTIKRKVPKKDAPGETIAIDVPVRTLRMSVYGSGEGDSDKAVRDFRDRLQQSVTLGPKLENIWVSQESDTIDGQDVVSYEIDCVFKPGV